MSSTLYYRRAYLAQPMIQTHVLGCFRPQRLHRSRSGTRDKSSETGNIARSSAGFATRM